MFDPDGNDMGRRALRLELDHESQVWEHQDVEFPVKPETIATLPGGWDLAHAIRLGIKPFAELGANSEALSGFQVDSPCSCRAIFESAPVAMLQSQFLLGEIRCQFIILARKDEPTPDYAPKATTLGRDLSSSAARGAARDRSDHLPSAARARPSRRAGPRASGPGVT